MKKAAGVVVLLALTCSSQSLFAQAHSFVGKWQTKISRVTRKHSITLNVSEDAGKLGGSVVLVNPDGSEMAEAILNPELRGRTLKFETKAGKDMFDWSLTLKEGGVEASLHGSVGELVIDERVVKEH